VECGLSAADGVWLGGVSGLVAETGYGAVFGEGVCVAGSRPLEG